MDAWQAADAEQDFGRLLESASRSGPQVVMRQARPAAVVMSIDDYRLLKGQADRHFAEFILASPLDPADFDAGMGTRLSDGD